MKVVLFYRPNSEYARASEEFVREFEHRSSKKIELVDIDSRDGIAKSQVYGVMDHPALVATSDDGQFLQAWTGKPFPTINDLLAYAADKR